jgi:hypothetical protein
VDICPQDSEANAEWLAAPLDAATAGRPKDSQWLAQLRLFRDCGAKP